MALAKPTFFICQCCNKEKSDSQKSMFNNSLCKNCIVPSHNKSDHVTVANLDDRSFNESDSTVLNNLAEVYQSIKKRNLKLCFNPNSNRQYITYDKKKLTYEIYLDPFDPAIDVKTAFEHEGSHYLHDSPLQTLKEIIK